MLAHVLRSVLLVLFAFTSLSQVVRAQASAQSGKLTPEQWRQDLRFFADQMARTHQNAFHTVSKEKFDAAVKRLEERIPSLAHHEIVVELIRIVALVGDGHTTVSFAARSHGHGPSDTRGAFKGDIYPVRFYQFKDGLYVQSAAPEYRDAVGGRVVAIGKTPIAQALASVSELVWRDNEMGIRANAPRFLTIPEVLHALKIADDLSKVNLVVEKDGKQSTIELKPTGRFQFHRGTPAGWVDARADAKAPTPLWLKNPDNRFWFEHLKDQGMLYVQFNAVQNKQDETVEAFFNKVFEYVEANQVDKLTLDLRLNGGGNNYLNLPITLGLIKSRVNKRGKLFVIIGRETFSAAQNTVNELEKYTNAIFIGEPTAATPNHFGDARPFVLPNSQLTVQASTLWWQDMDPRDRRHWTAPEIAAELSFEDYRMNNDPAMAAILKYTPGQSIAELIAGALANNNIADFVKRYRSFRSDPTRVYIDTESLINRLGYDLVSRHRLDDAIEVFKLNVEYYPRSANVYDSLAEAYVSKGDREQGIKYYNKALEIDPEFPSAVAALQKLKGH